MKKALDFLPDKPSEFIEQLVEVVRIYTSTEKRKEGFVFDTTTFGQVQGNSCFGCVATAYMLHVHKLSLDEMRDIAAKEHTGGNFPFKWRFYTSDGEKLRLPRITDIELIIDQIRKGNLQAMTRLYFNPDPERFQRMAIPPGYPLPWYIDSDAVKIGLSKMEAFGKRIKGFGF